MYFGADYHPEHWVFPYDGTEQEPEARWETDAQLMAAAGINVVRMGEFSWGLSERVEGQYDFAWLKRAMDVMGGAGIKVVLGTPTAAPPIWLGQKHPEILPLDELGQARREGTRRAYCLNSDVYWDYSKKIIRAMAGALGKHPQLVAWQIDNGLGRHNTETSFNPETKRDWHAWLRAKYETIEKLNNDLGLRFWGQVVSEWNQVPMPMITPAPHNPALVTDWRRFCSDTCVAYTKMQADLLRELTPSICLTTNLRAFAANFDYFDLAETLDFVSLDSDATVKSKSSEISCSIDYIRSLKKSNPRTPDGNQGFWVIEQKAGNVAWAEVNSLVRPGIIRLFTYQLISRGATGVLYFYWRQPRIGPEKFYGGVLTHDGRGDNRMYEEVRQIGAELKNLEPYLEGTSFTADACIVVNHASEWAMNQPLRPNKFFSQREHMQMFYSALHDRNILVDFARPTEDLSKYKLVIAPSLHLLAGGEADLLKLYVHNGGTLISTFNTGMVDEHHIAPVDGVPYCMTDLFGLVVKEFDPLPPGEENHLTFKGGFQTSHLHPARLWCDILEPRECQVVATYAKDFYAGKPAITINQFGEGRAIYIGTMSHLPFYQDLIVWVRQLCGLAPLLRVPDAVEVSMRQKEGGAKLYFLINHHHSPVRIQLFKPLHDLLSDTTISGNHDLPPHGILVLHDQVVII
jgi:beta-galactosidase